MEKKSNQTVEVKNVFPKHRQDLFAGDSWGYKDCYFEFDKGKNALFLRGDRYPKVTNNGYGNARDILKKFFFFDIYDLKVIPENTVPNPDDIKFHDDPEFRAAIEKAGIDQSIDLEDRYYRCHSQSPRDFYLLKFGGYKRIPDLVVWPKSHHEVEIIVKLANELNVVIIPVGGCTNVTSANNCPEKEERMIVSLDMTQMNRMLWLDENSMIACFEAGVAGQDLERTLQERGFIMGHEPDSVEFSTLGGWIATRSSGIKQQAYGNIEDIVVQTKTVTSIGVFEKKFIAPRVSMGPEFDEIVLGSEGTLGVITEAIVKIHKLPEEQRYGSIIFETFNDGVQCFRECSLKKVLPSSLRLLDNLHIQTGLALRYKESFFGDLLDSLKKLALVHILRYDEFSYFIATYLIEGDKKSVDQRENSLWEIAKKHGGLNTGPNFGRRGYFMTFTVGYVRDMFFRLGMLSDSIETSLSWDKVVSVVENIQRVYYQEVERLKVKGYILYRVSQVYHEGVCVYLYFGVFTCENHLQTFDHLSSVIKDSVKSSGGSLSHHHGIGKKNAYKYGKEISYVNKEMLMSVKQKLDPRNIFAAGNLIFNEHEQTVKAKL